MSPLSPNRQVERRTLMFAGILAAVAIGLAFAAPGSVATACQLAIFACLAPAVGCTVFALIHRMTGGQWTSGLAPYLRAGVAILPWVWLIAVPVLLLAPRAYAPGLGYESFPVVAARAVVFAALFFGIRWALSGGIGSEGSALGNDRPWAGPVGLIILFFMLTLLADDWLESLETGWHSTAFPVVWIAGQALCGLALCVLGALWNGVRPNSNGAAGRPLGVDWGNLLLAAMMFWTYVAFAQFLIIWAGNLPEETSWYLRRDHGPWALVVPAVALLGFVIPFACLLSRRLKQSASGLASVAGMLAVSQLAYTAWLIVPARGSLGPAGGLLVAASLASSLAFLASRFVRVARRLGGAV